MYRATAITDEISKFLAKSAAGWSDAKFALNPSLRVTGKAAVQVKDVCSSGASAQVKIAGYMRRGCAGPFFNTINN